MPVATLLSIAVTFWGSHGYVVDRPVVWEWENQVPVSTFSVVEHGHAIFGSYDIVLNRWWWDRLSNQSKCALVIHEIGHAVFSFPHVDGTVMNPDSTQFPPGICIRSKATWRALARQ